MTEHETFPGKVYAVTCRTGCTLTDDNGMNEIVEAGKQFRFMAQTAVVYTSEPATVTGGNFKLAPAELLGLLGGGASTGLPRGYLEAEFLESTGTQYIDTGYKPNADFGAYFDVQEVTTPSGNVYYCGAQVSGDALWLESRERLAICNGSGGRGAYWLEDAKVDKNRVQAVANLYNNRLYGKVGAEQTAGAVPSQNLTFTLFRSHYQRVGSFDPTAPLRMFAFKLTTGTELNLDFVPCLDVNGVSCMFDKVSKQPFRNSGSGQFIVGMTMAQARKLGKLPAGGGTLTVSLPSNYAEDEGVVNALAKAQENGWVITIQTYEAEAGAASTFALRRVWVRKRADEQGTYVDSDGFRWQVEWCVDVVGSSPEAEGYEPFRSVDVAVNYWNLQPWVDPEADEILTNTEEV